MLIRKSTIVAGAVLSFAAATYATPAAAQATRTWVSGVGDDANPCSRTAPCRTFAGAISKTAAGGEMNCLDSGGFGAVTITKAMSIICDGVIGGVLVAGTNAIVVNAGANDVIVLSGLDIEGAGTGLNGVRVLGARSVHVRNTIISGFNSATAGQGNGILFAPGGASELSVTDTMIVDTGVANNGSGIEIAPSAGGSARVNIRNVYLLDNGNNGVRLNTSNTTAAAGIIASIDDSEISGSVHGIVVFSPPGTTTAAAMVANSTVSNNSGFGILGSGAGATARVGLTTITGNGTGVLTASAASILSYGNNRLNGNGTDGVFSGAVATQ